MTEDLFPIAPALMQALPEDVARDDTPPAFDPDQAIARLSITLDAKARINDELKSLTGIEAALREQLETWFVETGQVTVKRHGLKLTLARRSDFRVIDVEKACAHLSDLGRLDEVMVTRADATIIATIGRELEGTETPLEGCERVPSARFTVTPIAAKGDDDAK